MKPLVLLLLVSLICVTAVPVMAAGDYMGGNIQLGGSGIKVTMVTTATQQVTAVAPPPTVMATNGSLSVNTTPPGAAIFLDSIQKGASPATITGIAPGNHILYLKLVGYQDMSETITITRGGMLNYSTRLTPLSEPATTSKKSPGFEAILGIAALGAVLAAKKTSR